MPRVGAGFLLLLGWLIPAVPAFAGAWTLDARSAHVFLTTLHYRASDVFDRRGNEVRLGNDGEFRKWELNPYIEYGLTDDVTLVANLFLRHVEFEDRFQRDENFGFADPEVGVRYRLAPRDWRTVWSVQGTVKLPVVLDTSTRPPLSNEQTDVELRLAAGRGFTLAGNPGFWNIEGAYRFRDGAPADEVRLDATLGYSPIPRWQLIGQFFGLRGLRNGTPLTIRGNPTIDPNFDLYKLQFSVVYQLAPRVAIQLGYVRDIAGRNTGAGQGALASLWLRF